jgi:enoyl-CoA hydratase/carnithine racemase
MNNVLLVRDQGPVRVLVNNNPAARNALSPEFFEALKRALAEAQSDPAVGAIVLSGADGFFCAGGDLRQLVKRRELPRSARRERIEDLHDMIRAVRDCAKPVVAAVEGGAAGAGVSLALAGDMLVMARNAYFAVAYVKVGLSPDGGATAFLSEVMPRQLVTELCLSGDRIDAERLAALGAVNRMAEPGQAEAEAVALAARIAGGPARAMARIKALCRHAPGAPLEAQLDLEARLMAESLGDDEAAEGIGAFLGKRAADFGALRGVGGEGA